MVHSDGDGDAEGAERQGLMYNIRDRKKHSRVVYNGVSW